MFRYFHLNKFRYDKKGQLAPVYIIIIVLVIMMAMVTVNLSKVASIRTASSNGSDAGALAAGSIMASVFNSIAFQNGELEKQYLEFLTSASVLFAIASYNLGFALSEVATAISLSTMALMNAACWICCNGVAPATGAVTQLNMAAPHLGYYKAAIIALGLAYVGFVIAQYYSYLGIRDVAENGRKNAIKNGHQLNFANSGIGGMLKGSQKDSYTSFLEKISDDDPVEEAYVFSFFDGSGRNHSITSNVSIDTVNVFKLKVSFLPTLVELAGLTAAWILGDTALSNISLAWVKLSSAIAMLSACCACAIPKCCAPKAAAAATALTAALALLGTAQTCLISAIPVLVADWAGLIAAREVTDDTDDSIVGWMNAICWILDIMDPKDEGNPHNRLVRVNNSQHHDGADLGLWKTQYPDTSTFSVVNFTGNGKIHKPELHHDASIVNTDKMVGELE